MMTLLKIAGWILVPELMVARAVINCAIEWAELLGLVAADDDSDGDDAAD